MGLAYRLGRMPPLHSVSPCVHRIADRAGRLPPLRLRGIVEVFSSGYLGSGVSSVFHLRMVCPHTPRIGLQTL
jgi:hypothetical protein